jgi:hypothetical protein
MYDVADFVKPTDLNLRRSGPSPGTLSPDRPTLSILMLLGRVQQRAPVGKLIRFQQPNNSLDRTILTVSIPSFRSN